MDRIFFQRLCAADHERIKNAMEKIPEEYTSPFREVIDILQSMLEDGE